jgi:hypothetical protein
MSALTPSSKVTMIDGAGQEVSVPHLGVFLFLAMGLVARSAAQVAVHRRPVRTTGGSPGSIRHATTKGRGVEAQLPDAVPLLLVGHLGVLH